MAARRYKSKLYEGKFVNLTKQLLPEFLSDDKKIP